MNSNELFHIIKLIWYPVSLEGQEEVLPLWDLAWMPLGLGEVVE